MNLDEKYVYYITTINSAIEKFIMSNNKHPMEIIIPNRTKAKQIAIPLTKALIYINTHEKELSEYNPENGWGSYYSLKDFVEQYLIACCDYPNARIKICR